MYDRLHQFLKKDKSLLFKTLRKKNYYYHFPHAYSGPKVEYITKNLHRIGTEIFDITILSCCKKVQEIEKHYHERCEVCGDKNYNILFSAKYDNANSYKEMFRSLSIPGFPKVFLANTEGLLMKLILMCFMDNKKETLIAIKELKDRFNFDIDLKVYYLVKNFVETSNLRCCGSKEYVKIHDYELTYVVGDIEVNRMWCLEDDDLENYINESPFGRCDVCMVERKKYAVVPCGHLCMCDWCSDKVDHCPICRVLISFRLEIFV